MWKGWGKKEPEENFYAKDHGKPLIDLEVFCSDVCFRKVTGCSLGKEHSQGEVRVDPMRSTKQTVDSYMN